MKKSNILYRVDPSHFIKLSEGELVSLIVIAFYNDDLISLKSKIKNMPEKNHLIDLVDKAPIPLNSKLYVSNFLSKTK